MLQASVEPFSTGTKDFHEHNLCRDKARGRMCKVNCSRVGRWIAPLSEQATKGRGGPGHGRRSLEELQEEEEEKLDQEEEEALSESSLSSVNLFQRLV